MIVAQPVTIRSASPPPARCALQAIIARRRLCSVKSCAGRPAAARVLRRASRRSRGSVTSAAARPSETDGRAQLARNEWKAKNALGWSQSPVKVMQKTKITPPRRLLRP